jgi:hypothetical protein
MEILKGGDQMSERNLKRYVGEELLDIFESGKRDRRTNSRKKHLIDVEKQLKRGTKRRRTRRH